MQKDCKFRHRNFYGIYHIADQPPSELIPGGLRVMTHGKTTHGAQLLAPEQRFTPITYYYRGGPFSNVYEITPSPRRIAVIGLGAGVISAYVRPNDSLTYFEIDPDNEKIARKWFTFLDDAGVRVWVVSGDGRLSLNETSKNINYNIITVDAFTGDGIPTHLLTREALEVYLGRLAEDGLMQFHISNRYYDLRGVLKATAAQLRLAGAMNIGSKTQISPYEGYGQWVVLARSPERLKTLLARGWVPFGDGDGLNYSAPWSDDYINILSPLWDRLWPPSAKVNTARADAGN